MPSLPSRRSHDRYPLRIASAANDILVDDAGRSYVDLFSSHGATWLGHCNPQVTATVAEQLGRIWLTAGIETPVLGEARRLIESHFPGTHRLAQLSSTGMEAVEFAIRVARGVTGRTGIVGFDRSMHGKSTVTAGLAWDNRDGIDLPFVHRLPFLPRCPEGEILAGLERALAGGDVSSVFIEPVQGCGGGHAASPAFHREVARLCTIHGALLVFDEILTGFHRTGPPFVFSELGFVPDIVLVGKSIGNGFPVSGTLVHERFEIRPTMLPGSTFAGSPLAAAAVVGTLRLASTIDVPAKVAAIDATIRRTLQPVADGGVAMRGRGALWVLEIPPAVDIESLVTDIVGAGVAVGVAGRLIRILPAATIEPHNLENACRVIRDALRARSADSGR